MSTWQSDALQRTELWYRTGPHVGHDVDDLIGCLNEIGHAPSVLLDIGCGTGRLIVELARTYPSLVATGYDADNVVVEYARNLIRTENLDDRCTVVAQDLIEWPVEAHGDLVTFMSVRALFSAGDRQLLRELKRLTTPGGVAAVDGIWTNRDGYANRRSDEFAEALADVGACVLATRERSLEQEHAANLSEAVGISHLWLVSFPAAKPSA